MTPSNPPSLDRPRRATGFTLVEVMISIAIALVLILGISQIFSLAQRTTGAGNAVISAVENVRAMEATFGQDFSSMANSVGDSPGIMIVSYAVPAFRSAQDKQQDRDGLPYTLNDPASGGSLTAMNYTQVNDRIHRVDKIFFFTRGHYLRQTSSGSNLTSPTTGSEAFVAVGHAALPNNVELKNWKWNAPQQVPTNGGYFNPGAPSVVGGATNDNNAFASDWILARNVILLSPTYPPLDLAGTYVATGTPPGDPLSSYTTAAAKAGTTIPLYSSRFDIDETSINGYRKYISNEITNTSPGNPHWWEYPSGVSVSVMVNEADPKAVRPSKISGDQRFEVNPFVIKPAAGSTGSGPAGQLSAAVAQAQPAMLRGCSQFIVEFAGDFVTQNSNGVIGTTDPAGNTTTGGPDGQIDFNVDPVTKAHSIRWYGFPRDPNDERSIGVLTASGGAYQYGVCPLRDTIQIAAPNTSSLIERVIPQKGTVNTAGTGQGYSANGFAGMAIANSQSSSLNLSQAYVVAWDPFTDGKQIARPKMIRITVGIDDAAGHLNTQQVYQYVFNLP